MSLEIYEITHDTFMVSLVGGISLLPMIAAGLWGGMLADAFDRRTLAIWDRAAELALHALARRGARSGT